MKNTLVPTVMICLELWANDPLMQMDQNQMQAMIAQMQQLQICMSKIDFSPLVKLETEALELEKKIEVLCQKGQRDKAQNKALEFSKRVLAMPSVKEINSCTKEFPIKDMIKIEQMDYSQHHVCDGEKIELGVPTNKRINW